MVSKWRKSMDGVHNAGFVAGVKGEDENTCPYEDYKTVREKKRVTYSRAFIREWNRGHQAGARFRERLLTTEK